MTNTFLAIDKEHFKLGLNPIELLTLSQVLEYDRTTGDCFISNETLAAQFGVSESTINRTIKALEDKGFVTRITKNVRGGKERHIKPNKDKINEKLASVNLNIDNDNKDTLQTSNCTLTTSKMNVDNKQNELIKENIKDNLKDNKQEMIQPQAAISISNVPEVKEEGTIDNPYLIPMRELSEKQRYLQPLSNGLYMDSNRVFYRMKEYKGA